MLKFGKGEKTENVVALKNQGNFRFQNRTLFIERTKCPIMPNTFKPRLCKNPYYTRPEGNKCQQIFGWLKPTPAERYVKNNES